MCHNLTFLTNKDKVYINCNYVVRKIELKNVQPLYGKGLLPIIS